MKFDKSGKLWFCQLRAKQIGVFFPDPGIFSVADMPGFNAVPQALAPADDEKIWFVDSMMNRVGYFDAITLKWGIFPIPTINSQPMDIEIDSKGDIWFTQSGHKANKIARLVRSTVPEAEALSGGGATGATDRGKKGWLDAQGSTKSKRVVSLVIAGAVIFIAIVLGFLYIRRPRSID
jgi:streptogramin lyase